MLSDNATAIQARVHAIQAGNIPNPFGPADPFLLDVMDDSAAITARVVGNLKPLMVSRLLSPTQASRMRRSGAGPIRDCARIVYGLGRSASSLAAAVVVHFQATLAQSLMPTTADELVARFWSLMEQESTAEGAENAAQATFCRSGDLLGMEEALMREAAVQAELIAVTRELRRRRIDPRTYGGRA